MSAGLRVGDRACRAFCLVLVFLSGFTALVFQVTWQKYPQELGLLIDAYRMARLAQLPARAENVVRLLPRACDDSNCSALKYRMLRTHLSDDVLRERGVGPIDDPRRIALEVRARIEAQYAAEFLAVQRDGVSPELADR